MFIIRPLLCRFFHCWLPSRKSLRDHGRLQEFSNGVFGAATIPTFPISIQRASLFLLGRTIYEPKPVSCHTHWNCLRHRSHGVHHASFGANLFTLSAGDRSANWVAFRHRRACVKPHGTAPALQGITDDSNRGLTDSGAPWGGLLRPRLEFSNALEALGVKYYRIFWRKGI